MKLFAKLKLENFSRPTQLLLLAVVLVVFVILILLSRSWSNNQIIKKVNISGNQLINSNEINDILYQYVINKLKKDIKLNNLRDTLLTNPYILNADLSIGITGNLNVEITERIPIAYLLNNNGNIDFVDKNAEILPFRVLKQMLDLPVITGLDRYAILDTNSLLIGCSIIEYIKNNSESDIYNKISELVYDRRYKSYNLVIDDYPGLIKFGRNDNLDDKFMKLDKLINTDSGYEVLKVADYIDLRWKSQIITGKI